MRHKFLTGLAVLVVVIVAIVLGTRGGSDTSGTSGVAQSPQASAPQAPAAQMPGLNTAVRDGNFEFTVKSWKCGVTSIGPAGAVDKAQGQFCLANVHVSNIGTEAQTLMASNQYAFNAEGVKYSASTGAGVVLQYGDALFKEINPGNALDGTVVFDVPKTTKIDHLELHDSPFSGGVSVKVG